MRSRLALVALSLASAPLVALAQEEAQCERLLRHASVSPSSVTILQTAVDGPREAIKSVTFQFEAKNRMGAIIRDRATCFFDPEWRAVQASGKSEDFKRAYGMFVMERFCMPDHCIERLSGPLHSVLWMTEAGALLPRATPD
jgi:hypothetical protein